MSHNALRRFSIALMMGASLAGLSAPVSAQIAVFDPTNYTQNILQATRALQTINNQIQSLQNEAQMIRDMATELKRLDVSALLKLNKDIAAINDLMKEAKGIAFTLSQTRAALKAQFPQGYDLSISGRGLSAQADARWHSAMDAFQQTLLVQSQISEALQSDAGTLNDLVRASESADGGLQAQQAANQLSALVAKQQMQITALMAAQYRAEALDAARKAEGEAAARAATRKFLGSGKAYTAQ
ncbi:P-type conjugative transfer protein TrbJ [Asticcacaulis excentricus]|uniref:P-type conjugative transfer protein TrbJ n=1 Tax=Asticcacaulis excentricus (strain ATCC 15261 / DSM 4724 / KCTC 12464 / NCIMB 9791 / VKM B-1370 / CB 48) TaxID=573065 RepID=E8RUT6_ASTEC|nr:P-type conjugative transfer protein TrbJ [Asticcacaulis excentricus]ADU14136.1 P-type conjugative transfer protein TrbJ [Asticcacaulis excentricus CB 48]